VTGGGASDQGNGAGPAAPQAGLDPSPAGAVFISYASKDASAADRIAGALRAAGIDVWFDQSELRGGDAWDRQIKKQIHDCALFIPVISEHTDARKEGYFRREWRLAADRTQDMADDASFLIPVVIDNTPDATARVPDKFREVQWTRLPDGVTPAAFTERLLRLLSPDVHVAPNSARMARRVRSDADAGSEALGNNPAALRRLQPALLLIAACVAFALVYFLISRFVLSKHPAETGRVSSPVAQPTSPPQSTIPEKSIAVLPFVDMSEKHDQEYFSDGLSEELIDMLAKVPDLRVPARTSSFYFKGKPTQVAEIAKALNVANVLEGSVRRSGSAVRITAHLVRTDSGYDVWSQSYDRDMKDIFQVQDEIAAAVVRALKATLLASTAPSDRTTNVDAYPLLLHGRYLIARQTNADMHEAAKVLQRAVKLDPAYAPAWAEMSYAYYQLAAYFQDVDEQRDYAQARIAVSKALKLDPENVLAHGVAARLKLQLEHDWEGAAAEIDAARRADPKFTEPPEFLYAAGCTSGPCYEQYIREVSQEIDHDPLNADALYDRGNMRFYAGELDLSELDIRRVVEVSPQRNAGYYELARILIARKKFTEALAAARAEDNAVYRRVAMALSYQALGRRADAEAELHELVANHSEDSPEDIAQVYMALGDNASALNCLERDYARRMAGILWVASDPLFKPLFREPRFNEMIKKIGYGKLKEGG
jgi:TolB-like protein/Tfp pilus assembly protein PilF